MNRKPPSPAAVPAAVFLLFFLFLLLLLGGLTAAPAYGQNENLLLNGDFEEGFTPFDNQSSLRVAAGWTPFWVIDDLDIPENDAGSRPEFMASNAPESPFPRAYTGQSAQMWHTKFSTAFAGVYQRVPVTPDSTLRLSAWSYAWSSEGSDPAVSQNGSWARQRVGIDPTGGTDPNSPNVLWSMPTQYLDSWGRISVEVEALADHVTVYLSAYPNRHLPQNDIYFDNAELILVSFALPTPAAGGAPLAAPTVDPLLTGLVTGQGVAPGSQGITFAETAPPLATGAADTARPPLWGLFLMLAIALAAGFLVLPGWLKRTHTAGEGSG